MSEARIAKTDLRHVKGDELMGVTVEKMRRHTHGPAPTQADMVPRLPKMSSRSQDFVYTNYAYGSSVENVNVVRMSEPVVTSVIREQYWACAKWPFGQKILAVAVGVLFGTVVGLVVVVIIRGIDSDDFSNFFRATAVPE